MTNHRAVIKRMSKMNQKWEATSDRRAIFLSCYLMMTENMVKAIDKGEFHDAGWVKVLLHRFADYYFEALEVYDRNSPATPPVWRVAHDATRFPETLALQNLLLGVNAHINYDLVLTVVELLDPEWAQLTESLRERRYADYSYVNAVIGRTIDAVQDQVIEKWNPSMDIVDKLLGPIDEWMTSSLMTHWRDEVWDSAQQMLDTADLQLRENLRVQVESGALERADLIQLNVSPTGIMKLF